MEQKTHSFPAWLLPAVFSGLAILLYLLPHSATESMEVHTAITGALRAGNNWGRQALVGNTDYPALQSIALLGCEVVAGLLHLHGPSLFCALVQAGLLCIFHPLGAGGAASAAGLASPGAHCRASIHSAFLHNAGPQLASRHSRS